MKLKIIYQNTLYKILNQNDLSTLKNIRNTDGISIVDYYKSMESQIENIQYI